MSDAPGIEDAIIASTPPVGVSSKQIFIVALTAIAGWLLIAGYILVNGPDPSDRAAILQSAINIATLAFGFYLGSSAGARNKGMGG